MPTTPDAPTTDDASDTAAPSGFEALGLRPELLSALTSLGYEEPTPIQRAAIPPLAEGRDVLGQAATGTGKTAAFALPLLQRLTPGRCGPFEAAVLVLVPTRELATQVAEAVHSYGRDMGVQVLPIYGGQDMAQQLRRLKRGVDVVVATPGRALDHLQRKTLKLERLQTVVLDEADEMLDMGFAEDLEAILSATPKGRQTALFSATLPPRIASIAEKHLRDPVRVQVRAERAKQGVVPRVRQTAYVVGRVHKGLTLGRVLDMEAPKSAIVFCRTRTEVDTLTASLNGQGLRAAALHGGMTQDQRERVMKRFKGNDLELLVATDVAARGLDIDKLTHVVNYDLPTSPEAYVHRIGRTGRAGREGVAISLVEPREHRFLKNIERLTGQPIELATVPTVADLRTRRLELTKASLREALVAGELDAYRSVVEGLAEEHDLMDVATAAVKLLSVQSGEPPADAQDIPTVRPGSADGERRGPRREGAAAAPRAPMQNAVMLQVSMGRNMNLRPADLVGALANEAGLTGKSIGSIQIGDSSSLVEVPADKADHVMEVLRNTTLRNRKVLVRPFKPGLGRMRDEGGGAERPPRRTPREDVEGDEERPARRAAREEEAEEPAAPARPFVPAAREPGAAPKQRKPREEGATFEARERPARGPFGRERPTRGSGGFGERGAASRPAGPRGAFSGERKPVSKDRGTFAGGKPPRKPRDG